MVLIYLSLGFLAGVAFVGLVRVVRQERLSRTRPRDAVSVPHPRRG